MYSLSLRERAGERVLLITLKVTKINVFHGIKSGI